MRDRNRVARAARRLGYSVDVTAAGHLKLRRDGLPLVVMAATPSDWRAQCNAVAFLRRTGHDDLADAVARRKRRVA